VDRCVLDEIAGFLSSKGAGGIGVYVQESNRRHPIHALVMGRPKVWNRLTIMWPYLRAKSVQAKLTLDYLQDKIAGNEFIKAMNAEVQAGGRAGKIYSLDQPFKRSEGVGKIWNRSLARLVFREMATTPDGHRRFGLNAVRRDIARGIETRKRILRLLCEGSKDTTAIKSENGRSFRQVRRLLKELEKIGYLRRERKSICDPYVWTITENGLRYAGEA
jgi:hypothetical protein